MNTILNGRNIAIGVITLALGVFVALGMGKIWAGQTTTVNGNVVSFILNPEGKVEGAILDTGDQVKFGEQTGELVASNIQIGGVLSATGDVGTKSNYGRELKAKTLQIGEQTITAVGGKKPKGEKGKRPHKPKKGERPEPKDAPQPDMRNGETPPAPKEVVKVSSNVRFVIVGKDGEAKGLILADGTNINLPKEVKDAGLKFAETMNVAIEGEVSKGNFGSFVKPNVLTINNQTFSFNR